MVHLQGLEGKGDQGHRDLGWDVGRTAPHQIAKIIPGFQKAELVELN